MCDKIFIIKNSLIEFLPKFKNMRLLILSLFLLCGSNLLSQTAENWFLKGAMLYTLEDNIGAIADLNKAIAIDPNYALAYNYRGLAKNRLEDYRGAIADFNKCLEVNPNYVMAYYGRGFAKYFLQDYRGSIIDYTKSIELDPNFAANYYGRGLAKISLHDKIGACLDWSKAGELGVGEAYDAIKIYCN
jgi:tetratricopeptide (TPR) repeat protein